jgi:putative hydrolase of HD superfamily
MDPTTIVQAQVDAYNARDIERFLSFYSPDAVVEDGRGTVMAQGHEALRALYGQLFAQSLDLHVEIPRRIHVGAYVIDEEETRGFIFEGFPSELHAAVVYRIEDDKIVRAQVFA